MNTLIDQILDLKEQTYESLLTLSQLRNKEAIARLAGDDHVATSCIQKYQEQINSISNKVHSLSNSAQPSQKALQPILLAPDKSEIDSNILQNPLSISMT